MTAETILQMIESVDPSDTAKLDEIDARVWIFLDPKRGQFKCIEPYTDYHVPDDCDPAETYKIMLVEPIESHPGAVTKRKSFHMPSVSYTRSRDALKQIRPEAYSFRIRAGRLSNNCKAVHIGRVPTVSFEYSGYKTEELAELHAIIQAINYERKQALDAQTP